MSSDEKKHDDSNIPIRDSTSGDIQNMEMPLDREKGIISECDEELVTFTGPSDPSSPFNWTTPKRIRIAFLISISSLTSLMTTSILAPALSSVSSDLNLTSSATQLTLSIYLLAFAVGPLLISPCSEIYGRKPVWLACNVWYIIWNSLAPVGKNRGLIFAGRFLSGLGGSVAVALPPSIMADMWPANQRGKSFAISTFAPLLGAAIGPIIGGYISANIGWPWLFWVVSLFDGLIVFLAVFIVHESYAPVLLSRKAKALRKSTGRNYRTEFERSHPTISGKLRVSLMRPLRLLVTRPVIQVVGFLIAYTFGVYTLVLSTFASLWTDQYNESISTSGLHYIAISLGSTLATQLGAPLTDKIYLHLKTKAHGVVSPEYRVPLMLPAALLAPIGILWYGWSAHAHLHWIMIDIGICIFALGFVLSTQAMVAYLIDEFGEYGASAMAASRLLSNLLGFGFPLFGPRLYEELGYGWGNTLLAGGFLVVGVPATGGLWVWGERLRGVGR